MIKNITDWPTTIVTVVSLVVTLLGLFGAVDMETVPALSDAFTGIGLSALTAIGILSTGKAKE